jgi:tetratricopeptide (TPR) repeat protein
LVGDATPVRIGRYEILGVLGEGAMGVVHRARDPELGREVALKVLRAGDAAPRQMIERFHREAQNAAQLSHPNLVRVYEAGRDGETLYIAMECIAGQALSAWRERSRPGRRAMVEMVERCARAVHAAHERGIVHRDLKPGNILVDGSGQPHVVDFGLSYAQVSDHALTKSGAVMGTPLYMAPEQVRGAVRETDARTDVYALGVILYELLGERPPFEADTSIELYEKILAAEPPRLRGVAADLEAVCLKAIEKRRESRYRSAAAFADDLRRFLDGEPISARGTVWWGRLGRRLRRWRVAIAVGAALVLLSGGSLLLWRALSRSEDRLLELMRRTARLTLQQALEWRRAGLPAKGADLLPELQVSCAEVRSKAPHLAEPHYHLGRMYRALMREDEAMAEQEEALRKEPGYAPSRYERGLLRLRRYERAVERAAQSQRLRAIQEGAPEAPPREDDEARAWKGRAVEDLRGLETLVARALVAWLEGDGTRARPLFEQAVRESPDTEEPYEWLARIERAAQRCEEAAEWYSRGHARDKGYLPFLLGRASTVGGHGDHLRYRGQDPMPAYKSALADFEAALPLASDRAWVLNALSVNWNSMGFARIGTPDESVAACFERALEYGTEAQRIAPGKPEAFVSAGMARLNRGYLALARGADPTEEAMKAIADFDRAAELDRADAESRARRGVVRSNLLMWRMGRGEDAEEVYRAGLADLDEAVRLDPSRHELLRFRAYLRMNWGYYLDLAGRDASDAYAAAVADLDEAVRMQPGDVENYATRGRARRNWAAGGGRLPGTALAMLDAALADFDRAIAMAGGSAERHLGRGLTLVNRTAHVPRAEWPEHYRRAIADYDEGIRLNPRNADLFLRRANARTNLAAHVEGEAMLKLYADAVADLDESLRLKPGQYEAYYMRAWTHTEWAISLQGPEVQRHARLAVADSDEASRINPQGWRALSEGGSARKLLGDQLSLAGQDPAATWEEGLALLERARKMKPNEAEIWQTIGSIHGLWVNHKVARRGKGGPKVEDLDKSAQEALSQAILLEPGKATTYRLRGLLHLQRFRHRDALSDFRTAVRLDPSQEKDLKPLMDICRMVVKE